MQVYYILQLLTFITTRFALYEGFLVVATHLQ